MRTPPPPPPGKSPYHWAPSSPLRRNAMEMEMAFRWHADDGPLRIMVQIPSPPFPSPLCKIWWLKPKRPKFYPPPSPTHLIKYFWIRARISCNIQHLVSFSFYDISRFVRTIASRVNPPPPPSLVCESWWQILWHSFFSLGGNKALHFTWIIKDAVFLATDARVCAKYISVEQVPTTQVDNDIYLAKC